MTRSEPRKKPLIPLNDSTAAEEELVARGPRKKIPLTESTAADEELVAMTRIEPRKKPLR